MSLAAEARPHGSRVRPGGIPPANHRLDEFAEDLVCCSVARSKAEGWLGQRQEIAKHLEYIRDTATNLLQQIGQHGAVALARRRGRPPRSGQSPVDSPKRARGRSKVDAEHVSRSASQISAAQKRRWTA